VTARATPEIAVARDVETFAAWRRAEQVALAETEIVRCVRTSLRRSGTVFVVAALDYPVVGRLHGMSDVVLAVAGAAGV
jgi:hypothetical protein